MQREDALGSITAGAIASRCHGCGAIAVLPSAAPGRMASYRNLTLLPIPADFEIPTCGACQRWQLDGATNARLLSILREQYGHALRARVRRAIDSLVLHISQRRLEGLLGLSQGYLSRLRAGAGTPSPELVSMLALLAEDPLIHLAQLRAYWSQTEPSNQAHHPAGHQTATPVSPAT